MASLTSLQSHLEKFRKSGEKLDEHQLDQLGLVKRELEKLFTAILPDLEDKHLAEEGGEP